MRSVFLPLGREANASARTFRELGKTPNLCQQLEDGGIMGGEFPALSFDLAGKLIHACCKLGACCQRRAHAYEGADDENADFHGAARAQDVCQHQAAVFGEGQG